MSDYIWNLIFINDLNNFEILNHRFSSNFLKINKFTE